MAMNLNLAFRKARSKLFAAIDARADLALKQTAGMGEAARRSIAQRYRCDRFNKETPK